MADEEKQTGMIKDCHGFYIVLLALVGVALACACAGLMMGYVWGMQDHKSTTPVTAAPQQTIAVTPAPTPIPTPAYPSVITYSVLSMTTAYGDYRIVTTTGQILICANSYDYNLHEPQNTYTSTITAVLDGRYYIASPILIAQHYNTVRDYRNYYTYDDDYYYRYNYGKEPCAGNMVCG